ncbi:MAG: hypothetical protein WA708_04310 [Acidobacteriaceae bacterium]
MESDWTVACGADDPMVVVPWRNAHNSLRYLDLRVVPEAINHVPEARQYPCVAAALRRWNQLDGPLSTVKCDVWNYRSDLFDAEDLPGFAHAQGSYIDLLPSERELFCNFSHCEKLLRASSEMAQGIALPAARCEWTLRPARIFLAAENNLSLLDSHVDGFAITLYVWGYGASREAAEDAWSSTISALIDPVIFAIGRRSRPFAAPGFQL